MKYIQIAFSIALLILVSVSTTGCTRAFRNVMGIQSAEKGTPNLETFKPKRAGFEVSMPGPRDEVATDDIMKRNYLYTHTDGTYSLTFGLAHGSLMGKQQVQTALDELCDNLVKSINGKATKTQAIEYYGAGVDDANGVRMGKEIEGTIGDGDQVFKARVYIIGSVSFKTAYSLVVAGKKPFVDSSEANRFISSLKLLD